jgi:chromosome segregation ATPase
VEDHQNCEHKLANDIKVLQNRGGQLEELLGERETKIASLTSQLASARKEIQSGEEEIGRK